jgi:chemotaxis protein CheD
VKVITVGISDLQFAEYPLKLITHGLGSCVAITLYAGDSGVGSMAHVMLPMSHDSQHIMVPGKYADTAVTHMVSAMGSRGITPSQLVAKIAGGADMFAGQFNGKGRGIGARNILSARKVLDKLGVPLVAQDVGGTTGRTVEFSTETGLMTVRALHGGVKEL